MTINELRTGNVVEAHCNCSCHNQSTVSMHIAPCCSSPVLTGTIDAIFNDEKTTGIGVSIDGKRYNIKNIKGVELTKLKVHSMGFLEMPDNETWILKENGSDTVEHIWSEYKNKQDFFFAIKYEGSEANGWMNTWYFNGIYLMPDVSFNYIHELQNFYHAISNEELYI